ncbi:MAG: hypothetical protein GY715_18210 [Planctomycetes bacterium]|nr:hypothetical protein [Planctomycetota bacterium]
MTRRPDAPMIRAWFDGEEPFLSASAAWLLDRARRDGAVSDLRHVVCLTPGRRAGRLLLAELIRRCEADGRVLTPPRLLTPGALGEALLGGETPNASRTERVYAWMRALRDHDPATLSPLLPTRPDADDDLAWHALARRIETVHRELAGELVSFEAMSVHADEMLMDREAERWRALASVHRLYRTALEAADRVDPDEAAAAALDPCELDADVHVVLAGIADLNALQRRIVLALGDRAAALVAAPESMASRFDELGCVRPQAWADAEITVDEDQLVVADRPCDQAQAALEVLAGIDPAPTPDQITVGLGDEALVAPFQSAGQWAGVRFHHASGRALTSTAPVRLLAAITDVLEDATIERLASLLRHGDFETWFDQDHVAARAIGDLDRYAAEHPGDGRVDGWRDDPDAAVAERLETLTEVVRGLLAGLDGGPRVMSRWTGPILDVLASVYRAASEDTALAACAAVRDLLAEYRQAAAELEPATDAVTALRLLLADAEHESIADDPRADEIELLGWLELALDPARVLIAAGINDGHVPGSVTADAFLPDSLRAKAGLMCNARRYARDAHVLETLRHGGRRVVLIAGRRDADGEPLTPSRLLLAGPRDTLARRVLDLSDAKRARQFRGRRGASAPAPTSRFTVPEAPAGPCEIDHLSVTSFRSYLQCPYRFWLGRVMRLRRAAGGGDELDALQFGILAHDVLCDFGRDETARDSTDAERITAFLHTALDRRVHARCGAELPPAVAIQVARLRLRLEAFARRQAAHRADGWEIREAEYELPKSAALEMGTGGEKAMPIRGKIDRLDHRDGTWLIIDYKTGEKTADPEAAHRHKGSWVDLQLPMYGYLAPRHGFEGRPDLAYFSLPRDPADTGLRRAPWSDVERDEAVEVARQVVRDVRSGKFVMSPDYPLRFRDDFEYICQTTVLGGTGEEIEP